FFRKPACEKPVADVGPMRHLHVVAPVRDGFLSGDDVLEEFASLFDRHALDCDCDLARMLVRNVLFPDSGAHVLCLVVFLKSVTKLWHVNHFNGTYKLDREAPTPGAPCCTRLFVIAYSPR